MYRANSSGDKTEAMRIVEADFLRCFAILAVIAIHTSAFFARSDSLSYLVIANIVVDIFSHYAVPAFIIVSGMVLSVKYGNNFSLPRFYQKRFMSVIPQYLFFSVFYMLVVGIFTNSIPSWTDVAISLATATGSYHLWFIALIIQFYLFYPLLIRIYEQGEKKYGGMTLLGLFLAVQVLWGLFKVGLLSGLTGNATWSTPLMTTILEEVFLSYIFYFTAGIYIGRNLPALRLRFSSVNSKVVAAVVGMLVLCYSYTWAIGLSIYGGFHNIPPISFWVDQLIGPVLFGLTIILLYKLSLTLAGKKNRISRLAGSIGKYSFAIYLIHVFFMYVLQVGYARIGITWQDWAFYPLMFVSTVALSFASAIMISYLPLSKHIIGVHNQLKRDPGTRGVEVPTN